MNDYDDLTWLRDRQSHVPVPDAAATARARAALLARADPAPLALVADEGRDVVVGDRRRRARPRILTLTGVAAVAAVGVVVVAGGLPSGSGGTGVIAPPQSAEAATLIRLSRSIAAAPAATGDATLVVRHTPSSDGSSITAVDLYLDDGRYKFAHSVAGLRGEDVEDIPGGAHTKQKLAAAAAAATLPAAQAREAIVEADAPPGFPDHMGEPGLPGIDAVPEEDRVIGRHTSAELRTDPVRRAALVENVFWGNTTDALVAGAGRADVRAGVMKLLATSSTVNVVKATVAGKPVLKITETAFGGGYAETLTVDASSGVITALTGADTGKAPSVTVDYDVKRVTSSDVLGN
jgi:hypothetical protein